MWEDGLLTDVNRAYSSFLTKYLSHKKIIKKQRKQSGWLTKGIKV
jgi:hypothetical protein